mmetsp:Transcript_14610/g.21355  ORF Transcript_14610/g.21355 Transcript_14610/m.21355 type:complete len:248 (+) Transcript_14610:292-1035(+)
MRGKILVSSSSMYLVTPFANVSSIRKSRIFSTPRPSSTACPDASIARSFSCRATKVFRASVGSSLSGSSETFVFPSLSRCSSSFFKTCTSPATRYVNIFSKKANLTARHLSCASSNGSRCFVNFKRSASSMRMALLMCVISTSGFDLIFAAFSKAGSTLHRADHSDAERSCAMLEAISASWSSVLYFSINPKKPMRSPFDRALTVQVNTGVANITASIPTSSLPCSASLKISLNKGNRTFSSSSRCT